ncbi:MAG: hypothetical protein ABH828_00225 [archaeon]
MSEHSKALVETGFLNAKGKAKKKELGDDWSKFVKQLNDKTSEDYADEEVSEEAKLEPENEMGFSNYFKTGYPEPIKKYRMMYESFQASIEESYFWVLSQLRRDWNYHTFYKITDIFSASEQSAFWGAAQARLKIQQETVSQYLIAIGKLIRELFQIVRELRIIDERLVMYDNWEESKSADISLKGLYIDMVEGASKNPSSVYGLAQQVGFTILPDLFFNTHVYRPKDVDTVVENTKYNKSIKNVLKRKLYSYVTWKIKTDEELRSRRKFQLKYLRQHWAVIKMYMDWIKPYLRNIRRMQMSEKHIESVDMVSAFEGSMVEVEFLAVKPLYQGIHPVIMASFEYRTRPEMSFHQDQYAHKGPVHMGKVRFELRCYIWTPKQIEEYKKYRRQESMKLFSLIDGSVKAAMEALGDELENYLIEAGEDTQLRDEIEKTAPKKRPKSYGILDPFVAVVKGFGDIFTSMVPISSSSSGGSKKTKEETPSKEAKKLAASTLQFNAYQTYKNYKKSHGMVTW